jgi:hypothetical protein
VNEANKAPKVTQVDLKAPKATLVPLRTTSQLTRASLALLRIGWIPLWDLKAPKVTPVLTALTEPMALMEQTEQMVLRSSQARSLPITAMATTVTSTFALTVTSIRR